MSKIRIPGFRMTYEIRQPTYAGPPVTRLCAIEGCNKPLKYGGLCSMHAARKERHGDPLITLNPGLEMVPSERLLSRIEIPVPGGCWLWTGMCIKGYGVVSIGSQKRVYAHRFAYETFVGPIPAGLELDHLCRMTECVKPAHLEPVSHTENVLRGESPMAKQARQITCLLGHPLTFDAMGHRYCKTCKNARRRMGARDGSD